MKVNDLPHESGAMPRRMKIGWFVFAAVAGFYLWTEHRAHLLGALPFLLLLACPLIHLFVHHGHARGGKTPPSTPASESADGEQP